MSEDYDNEYNDAPERTVSELEEVHSTLQEILSTLKSKLDWSGVFWFVVVILLIGGWSGSKLDRWTDKVWYSMSASTDWKNIDVQKMPTDCNFLRAPLGDKDCHYTKHAEVFGDEQRRKLIGLATNPQEAQQYSQRPNSVNVYWERKEE